jgi:serine/threonine-protein kinase
LTLEAGTRLGSYEISSLLGKGGMGEVYRARDAKLGREVAIKVLPEEVAADPERLSRFEREARMLASLNHPNVATLHGFEEADGGHFLVMELAEGETLADRIARGPMAPAEAIPLFVQITQGLEAAHERGIVHRDLKPANVKLGGAGDAAGSRVKILDFGLAKALVDEPEAGDPMTSDSPTLKMAATMRGEILGTAAYMSPEQAKGEAVDQRADVWAFGVCLYEALVGERLFRAPSVAETLAIVIEREPRWEKVPADTPALLVRVPRKCLAKNPLERWRDVSDLRFLLVDCLSEETLELAVPVRPRPAWSWLVAAAAAGVVVAGLALSSSRPVERPRVARSVLDVPPSEPVRLLGDNPGLAITPDGASVIYTAGGRRAGLYRRSLDSLEGTWAVARGGAMAPFVSPDGEWIGFVSDSNTVLRRVPVRGGTTQMIHDGEVQVLGGGSWGEDGSLVFSRWREGLFRIPPQGGEPEFLVASEREEAFVWPEVLPGDEAVLFTIKNERDDGRIAVLDLRDREVTVLLAGSGYARYSATGHLVFGAGGELRAVAFDRERLELRGAPVTLLEGLPIKPQGTLDFALSKDGDLAYVSGLGGIPPQRLAWVDRTGGEEAIEAEARPYRYPRLSPEGRRIALTDRGSGGVWVWDLDRGVLTQVADETVYSVWIEDGREIVVTQSNPQTANRIEALYRVASDGVGEAQRLTGSEFMAYPESVSADGSALLFRTGLTRTDVGLVDLGSEGEIRLLLASPDFNELNAEISPDGRWLVYQSDESGRDEVYVRPFPRIEGGRWQVSTDGGFAPKWSRSGREIFYRELGSGDMMAAPVSLAEAAFDAGVPARLFDGSGYVRGEIGRNWDLAPDGRFLMIRPAVAAAPPRVVYVQNFAEELRRLAPLDGCVSGCPSSFDPPLDRSPRALTSRWRRERPKAARRPQRISGVYDRPDD